VESILNRTGHACESEGVSIEQAREVRAQVDRIAASAPFAESERLRRFLVFTTEASLSGDAASLKEYVLGREVFERDGDYDPRLDPIVRVEARRLRAKLSQYYNGPGRKERLRIEYPKGGYAPLFVNAPKSVARSAPRVWIALAAALTLLIATALVWRGAASRETDMVAVLPAQWVNSDHADTDPRAVALSEALTIELANRRIAPVIAWPIVAQRQLADRPFREIAQQLGASRLLIVTARQSDGGADLITLFDVDAHTGQKRRALRYLTPVISLSEQQHLAQRMASDLAAGSAASTK
jgi:serine/threonine-protein kinase